MLNLNQYEDSDGWVHRPWGKFLVVVDQPHTKVKRLIIYPGKRTSLQSHIKRREIWTVVQGTPTIKWESSAEFVLGTREVMEIDEGIKHRISNNTNELVEIIEVQTGEYFGEDDIIRYEDDFGRL